MTKNNIISNMLSLFVIMIILFPFSARSQSQNVTSENFQIVPVDCHSVSADGKSLTKDLGGCGWEDLLTLIGNIMKFAVYISASLSAIAFAYAGFLYMTAFGQSGKIEQAHGIFTKTLIGIFFVLCSYLLVALVLKSLGVNANFSLINF